MKRINENRQSQIKNVIENNTEHITGVLEKLVANKWTELTPAQNTVRRLKRKGRRNSAEQFMRLHERLNQSDSNAEVKEDISTILNESNQIIKEGIVGSNDMVTTNFLHKGSRVARCVGRISYRDTREALGTGFLVSPNIIMTNNHVLPDVNEASQCIVEFNYVANDTGAMIEANEFRLLPEKFFLTSNESEFDYSLVAVEPKNTVGTESKSFGTINLIEDIGKATKGERLNIIHHPLGKPQQISIRKNLVITHDESLVRIFYMTDTEAGSSGSPVLNDEWELVALHYASYEIKNDHQKKLFFQHMNRTSHDLNNEFEDIVRVNVGMRISAIVNNIKTLQEGLTLEEKSLIQDVLKIDHPYTSNTQNVLPWVNEKKSVEDSLASGAPINVNINIGNRNYNDPPYHTNIRPKTSSSFSSDSFDRMNTKLEIFNSKLNSQKSVFKALLFLEKARNNEYLPSKAKITSLKNSYYDSIIDEVNNGLSGTQLYERLNSLMIGTLRLADRFPDTNLDLEGLFESSDLESFVLEGGLSYARSRAHLYTWVDLQEDRMLKCAYTQVPIAPEQLLLKDLIQSLKLDISLPRRYKNNQFLNCEHIVPQSLFNKDPLGVSDLHHLITAEGATNTFRSNSPYRDLGTNGEKGPSSLPDYIKAGGKKENGFFEPFNSKSLVARATLYFIVAHKKKLGKSAYDSDGIDTLINWSNKAKPSSYELHRNEAIFEIQGNRNPFIDFPDWVNKVDFLAGLV